VSLWVVSYLYLGYVSILINFIAWLVDKIKILRVEFDFSSRTWCSKAIMFFFSLLNTMAVVRASFFSTQLGKHQNSAQALSVLSPNFHCGLWKIDILYFHVSFFFSPAYVHRTQLIIIPIKLATQQSILALSTTGFFSVACLRRKQITSDCFGLVILHFNCAYQSRNRFEPSNSKRDNMYLIQDKYLRIIFWISAPNHLLCFSPKLLL